MNYNPDLISTSIKMFAAMIAALAILSVVYYFMKKGIKRKTSGGKDNLIKILSNSYVGVKQRISLIEIPGFILVLGITNDKISLLAKIDDEKLIKQYHLTENRKMSPTFSDHLKRLTSRQSHEMIKNE